MSDDSNIEWTDATWNPVRGCTKVSPGCKHCYAETFAERWRGIAGHPYERGFDPREVSDQLGLPLSWRKPRRIFVNSMSDLFMEEVSDEYIATVFGVMAAASRHTFQVLTKRAKRLPDWFAWAARQTFGDLPHGRDPTEYADPLCALMSALAECPAHLPGLDAEGDEGDQLARALNVPWPLPNVHLGVSVEDRKYGLPRIEALREVPAALRFLSIEPLLDDLGPLDLRGIGWVIVGGESGPGARPMRPEWVRSIRDQCIAANVPFFFKQWGGVLKKKTGRDLDGRTWDEFPREPSGG